MFPTFEISCKLEFVSFFQFVKLSPIREFPIPIVSSHSSIGGSPTINAHRKMTTFGAPQRLIAAINTELATGENVMKIVPS